MQTTANSSSNYRILLLPGWLNSSASHWQSRWEAIYGDQRVEQDDWLWPKRGDWMARLEEVILDDAKPAVLIAHSLGCHLVAEWAAHSKHTALVRAAVLVAFPDIERDDIPANVQGWRPISRNPLPFDSMAVVSDDDPYCDPKRAEEIVAAWGCESFHIGRRGHINGDSDLGDWTQGRVLLQSLLDR